jgi:rare lipoprotein A
MNTKDAIFLIVLNIALNPLIFGENATSITYVQEGVASWYGAEFEGKPTASGEPFSTQSLTAAHPSLPFGTMVRITNMQNGKQTMVRINDRGPFVPNRIIDVSRIAAEQLDMLSTGTAPVRIEVLGDTTQNTTFESSEQVSKQVKMTQIKTYRIQVGSYRQTQNALNTIKKLQQSGFSPAYERWNEVYRVVVAGVPAEDLEATIVQLKNAGFTDLLIREEQR